MQLCLPKPSRRDAIWTGTAVICHKNIPTYKPQQICFQAVNFLRALNTKIGAFAGVEAGSTMTLRTFSSWENIIDAQLSSRPLLKRTFPWSSWPCKCLRASPQCSGSLCWMVEGPRTQSIGVCTPALYSSPIWARSMSFCSRRTPCFKSSQRNGPRKETNTTPSHCARQLTTWITQKTYHLHRGIE